MKQPQSQKELIDTLRRLEGQQLIDGDTLHMLEGALTVSTLQARDCMIPQVHVVSIGISESPQDFMPRLLASKHSRFPIFNAQGDQILGVTLAKDLLAYFADGGSIDGLKLEDYIRPAVFIPESKPLDKLLKELRAQHQHLAIVLDEYGMPSGLMTIEDIIEHIVGDIEDEHYNECPEDEAIKTIGDHEWIVNGLTHLDEFNAQTQAQLNGNRGTVGGLVAQAFGFLPAPGQCVSLQGFVAEVLTCDEKRITLLKMSRSETSSIEP